MTSRWRHCHGNFTLVHTIYICSAFFHCEQVAIRWIILFSASGIHAPLRPWERPACYLFQCSFSYVLTKKRHWRFFDRLYDTLDMSVWIEKLTNRWPPIKNQPIKIQRIVWCRIIHRTIYILKMRHQNRDEFHQFQEYSSQIQNLVIVDHMADSGISLLRNTNSLRNYNVSLSLTNSVKWDAWRDSCVFSK